MVAVKGSSLMESLVALSIVSISFVAGMMLVGILLSSQDSALKLRAEMALKVIAFDTKSNEHFIDEWIDSADFSVKKEIIPFQDSKNTYTLKLIATDAKSKILTTYQELIYIP